MVEWSDRLPCIGLLIKGSIYPLYRTGSGGITHMVVVLMFGI